MDFVEVLRVVESTWGAAEGVFANGYAWRREGGIVRLAKTWEGCPPGQEVVSVVAEVGHATATWRVNSEMPVERAWPSALSFLRANAPSAEPTRLRWSREGDGWSCKLGGAWKAWVTPVHERSVWKVRLVCSAAMIAVEGPKYTGMTLAACKRWVVAMLPALDAIADAGERAVAETFPVKEG